VLAFYPSYSHPSLKRLEPRWAQASFQLFCSWFVNCGLKHFSALLLSFGCENNSGSGEHLWLSSGPWKHPRIGSSAGFVSLLAFIQTRELSKCCSVCWTQLFLLSSNLSLCNKKNSVVLSIELLCMKKCTTFTPVALRN
jgi:hypothetical protein